MLVAGLAIAAGGGWLLLQMVQPPSLQSATRAQLDQQVQDQLRHRRRDSLPPDEERRLLERLIALGRSRDAIALVQDQLKQHPKDWRWRLLLSELLRRSGQQSAADRELALLLRLHPEQEEVLKVASLNDLNRGRSKVAIERVKRRFDARPPGQRLKLGLLLADLQRQSGQVKDATTTYQQLAKENGSDPRPLLALALIRQEQGQGAAAQELLAQAQRRQSPEQASQRPLAGLAARWALLSARSTTNLKALKAGATDQAGQAPPSDSP